MKIDGVHRAGISLAALLLVSISSAALAADPIKGMIVAKDGMNLVIRTGDTDETIKLTETTKIRGVVGSLGVREETRTAADLIRGLPVEVKTEEGTMTAVEVKFKQGDLKNAKMISAGIAGTESRIDNIGEMEAVGRTNILFASGSSTISAEGKKELQDIAAKASSVTGYRLSIVGRADTTGNAAANQKLSERRAAAVKEYLIKSAGVLPVRILPSAAVGDSVVAQDPNPPKSQADARRVTVTILQSKSARPQ